MLYTKPARLPVLDGLRFIAAVSVAMAHCYSWIIVDQGFISRLHSVMINMSGIGMCLFFVLSGFVIHYNYHSLHDVPRGKFKFFVARFSRLYPLYIVLIAIEFIWTYHSYNGSCGHADHQRAGLFLSLPYYLTMTQSWFFGIICTNNIAYQYHMMAPVTWSISVEIFFYLLYPLILYFLFRPGTAAGKWAFTIGCYVITTLLMYYADIHTKDINAVAVAAFGKPASSDPIYQDSLLRWLVYFNPLASMANFACGMLAADIYMKRRHMAATPKTARCGAVLTVISILLVIIAHVWCYHILGGVRPVWIERAGQMLEAPFVGLMIYMLVRYPQTIIARLLACWPMVLLGEASYSIYLLHAYFARWPRDYYSLGLNPWLLYALWLTFIIIASRLCFMFFERPVQRYLRRKMLPD